MEVGTKIIELLAVPRIHDSVIRDVVRPNHILIIKGAGQRLHIGRDIHGVATTLAAVDAFGGDMRRVIQNCRDSTAVKAHLERESALVNELKELNHLRVASLQHVIFFAQTNRLVQQEDDGVDALGEAVILQAGNGFVNGVITKDEVNVRLDAGIQQHLNSGWGVIIAFVE